MGMLPEGFATGFDDGANQDEDQDYYSAVMTKDLWAQGSDYEVLAQSQASSSSIRVC